jgi:hypothetical protein
MAKTAKKLQTCAWTYQSRLELVTFVSDSVEAFHERQTLCAAT